MEASIGKKLSFYMDLGPDKVGWHGNLYGDQIWADEGQGEYVLVHPRRVPHEHVTLKPGTKCMYCAAYKGKYLLISGAPKASASVICEQGCQRLLGLAVAVRHGDALAAHFKKLVTPTGKTETETKTQGDVLEYGLRVIEELERQKDTQAGASVLEMVAEHAEKVFADIGSL